MMSKDMDIKIWQPKNVRKQEIGLKGLQKLKELLRNLR
jgi:hypothetical protein